MSRFILKLLNFLVSFVVVTALITSAAFAGYSLWDNSRIYSAAEDVQRDMIKMKPEEPEKDNGASFDELKSINPDVRAWLSVDKTKIDYPILQGDNNLSYINTDVYGNFALAGSLFMDSRNARDFSDRYILFYGHHMDGGNMFGDLDKFKDRKFFEKYGTGTLILPDKSFTLQAFAVMVLKASDSRIFDPVSWKDDSSGLPAAVSDSSMYTKDDIISYINDNPEAQILALTTCTNEFTDARTVVLTLMQPGQSAGMEE